MKTLLRPCFAAIAVALTAGSASARIERVVEKTFSTGPAGTLHVDCHSGSIRVEPGDGASVSIAAQQKIRAKNDAEADELLKKLTLVMEQDGDTVRVSSKYEKRPMGFNWGSWPPVQVDFVIRVPAGFATDLRSSGGSIHVGDLGGKAVARTSGGSITFGRMSSSVEARTSGGSITLGEASGSVDLETSGGSITAGKINGRAELSTSGGSIRVEEVVGAVRAHTSGGSVRAGLAGPLTGDSSLSTSGGSVRVAVDPALAFRLDASSSGGSVQADGVTIRTNEKERSRTRLAGDVNGGGPLLKLRSSGGSAVVQAR